MTAPEQTLLEAHGCRLTDRRFVTPGGWTYVLQQITSTRLEQRARGGELAGALILGAIVALGSGNGAVGLAFAVGAVLAWVLLHRTEYTLYLTTSGGEKQAIASRDRSFMVHLRDTLNDALASPH